MFSMLPPSSGHHFSQTHSYQFSPVVPSPLSSSPLRSSPTPTPLSPRDANSSPTRQYHSEDNFMSSPTPPAKSDTIRRHNISHISLPSPPPSKRKESSFANRATKANPLLKKDTDARETRRKLFLKNMRESREDKKWQDRKGGEEMMRVLWIGEERERTRRLEGGMNSVEVPIEDEMDSIMEPALVTDAEQLMADEVAINEAAELEARLAEILPEQHGLNQWGEYDFNPEQTSTLDAQTSYGSDDEYDDIFMDVAKEEIRTSSQPCHGQQQEPLGYLQNQDQEMMDLS